MKNLITPLLATIIGGLVVAAITKKYSSATIAMQGSPVNIDPSHQNLIDTNKKINSLTLIDEFDRDSL